jgi:hypothetical protein
VTATGPATQAHEPVHPAGLEDAIDRQVFGHLAAEFGDRVPHDRITAAVVTARRQLGEPRIITYVPILLERLAREFVRAGDREHEPA